VVRDRDGVVWELERPLWGRTSREQLIVYLVAHGGGHPKMAARVLPVDVGRDLARRSRAEIRFRPVFRPATKLNLCEFWAARTHNQKLHELRDQRRTYHSH
jgi:hypothetical protein